MTCRLFHKWGRWVRIPIEYYDTRGAGLVYALTGQRRTCTRCGKTTTRTEA